MRVFVIDASWQSSLLVFMNSRWVDYKCNIDRPFGGSLSFDLNYVNDRGQLDTLETCESLVQHLTHRRNRPIEVATYREIQWSDLSKVNRHLILRQFRELHFGHRLQSLALFPQRDEQSITVLGSTLMTLGARDMVKRIYKLKKELGQLIAQERKECDGEQLDRICEIANDHFEFASPRIRLKIAQLEIGITLADCGHLVPDDEVNQVANSRGRLTDTACANCYEDSEVVVYCVDDDLRHWRDDVYYWESDDEYHLREEEYDDDSTSSDDPDCRLDYDCDVMQFLSKDNSFESTAHGDFHMGIELETANRESSIDDKVYQVRRELGQDYVVCKYDGSVGDRSMEWVTRPTSLKVHIEKLGGWKSTDGLIAWNNRSCGMHVHIDSKAFTALTLGKMIQFYNSPRNDTFIRSIAGRHPRHDSQAAEYAALDSSTVVYSPNAALKGKDASRYRMINCENLSHEESIRLGLKDRWGSSDTVEIRIFRASLKKERLLAQIEFAHAAVMFCRVTSYRNLDQDHFMKWLRNSSGLYSNLCKWFGINNRHGKTVTQTDSLTNASADSQPELFVQAA